MNTIDKYNDAAVIRAFLMRNFSEVGYEFVDDVITSIKPYAFAEVTDLKTLGLPSITVIPDACFYHAKVSDSSDFSWDKITAIGPSAFFESEVVKQGALVLPELVEIGRAAFAGVTGITSFTADRLERIVTKNGPYLSSSGVFKGSSIQSFSAAVLNDSGFGTSCFEDCTGLISVNLPEYEKGSISMFDGCTALTDVSMPKLKTIAASEMFRNCSGLKTISFPELETISGSSTFGNCTSLTTVNLPKLKGVIGDYTFVSCTELNSIDFPEVTEIGSYAFNGCQKLTDVNLPKVTKIGTNGLYSCKMLKDVNLPELETINQNGLGYASSVEILEFPKLAILGNSAFSWDTALRKITIGGDVKEFPGNLFSRAVSLEAILLPGITTVPKLGSSVFAGATRITNKEGSIYVPDGLVDSFRADEGWSKYSILAISTYNGE